MLEKVILKRWYPDESDHAVNALILLRPLSSLYGFITKQRFSKRRINETPPGAENTQQALVVVIGNITVGGTGKTPLIIAVAAQLVSLGLRVGVVSGGYGSQFTRRHKDGSLLVETRHSADQVGDEPLLICRKLSQLATTASAAPVVIARKRAKAVARLQSEFTLDVILSDDGLQHYAMARDLEYVVLDGSRGLGNGRLLPEGPLREPAGRLAQADFVIVNGAPKSPLKKLFRRLELPYYVVEMQNAELLAVNLAAKNLLNSNFPQAVNELADFAAKVPWIKCIHLLAGIGNPGKFFCSMRARLSCETNRWQWTENAFPDHHSFTIDEFEALLDPRYAANEQLVLLTEKDAVKLAEFADSIDMPIVASTLTVEIDKALINPILERLADTIQQELQDQS